VSLRRDAVPDDTRVSRCSPNPTNAFEHAIQIGTRESPWTRHDVGGPRADHGRKREPGDGHFRDRDSSQDRKLFQSTDPGPEPYDLRDIMNPPGDIRPVAGAEARERKTSRDGRLLKIVLDGKCPVTEAGDPKERARL